jgi:hypothetical protein
MEIAYSQESATTTDQLWKLQGRYDRLTAHQARLIRYHDECQDGDRRKTDAEHQLADLDRRVAEVEAEFDRALDPEN